MMRVIFTVAPILFGLSIGALSLARLALAHELERRGQREPAPVAAEPTRDLVGSRS
jgi:hypothetical protein